MSLPFSRLLCILWISGRIFPHSISSLKLSIAFFPTPAFQTILSVLSFSRRYSGHCLVQVWLGHPPGLSCMSLKFPLTSFLSVLVVFPCWVLVSWVLHLFLSPFSLSSRKNTIFQDLLRKGCVERNCSVCGCLEISFRFLLCCFMLASHIIIHLL